MKSNSALDASQRAAARVAGIALVLGLVIVIVSNYGINFRLIVPGNAAETARNILANETLFRINIVCNLVFAINIVVLLAALYVVLKPVNRNLALVAAFCRLLVAVMWTVTALNTLSALRFLGGTTYLPVFNTDQLQTLARLQLASSYDAYYIGLPFWGLASTVCCWLLFKSRYVPRALAAAGVVSSAWCVFCAFAFIIYPRFDVTVNPYWFDSPLALFEVVLGFWLVLRGLSSPERQVDSARVPQ
jgi:Domain of unknown function (DUF4386)